MNIQTFDGLIWLVLMLLPLLFLQRQFHRELQAIFLILTNRRSLTIVTFALIFFPGVFLHETSHFLMAKLLRVPTHGFSLIPEAKGDGKIRLGSVMVEKADLLRDSLIGAAPLISGGLFVSYAAVAKLGLLPLWTALRAFNFSAFWTGFFSLSDQPDFWLWAYLAFTVSSMMLPSESDRDAWLPLAGVIVLLVGIAALVGAGNWMLANLAPKLNTFFRSLATIFGLSAAAHGLFLIPLLLIHKGAARLMKRDIR